MHIEKLTFNNMFSYGEGNEISFIDNKVTLIEGKIGAGKSSIPTILEELLYNKNSRGFLKSDILNDSCGKNNYSGTVEFSINKDKYILTKDVKTSAKVTLSKNGVDISGNTATTTYKILEGIIGLDFTSFTKLVYQSMTSQMDFLSATDAKRKEFLTGLMNLGIYSEIESVIKADKKEIDDELNILSGKISTLSEFVNRYLARDKLEYVPVPCAPNLYPLIEELYDKISKIKFYNSNIEDEIKRKSKVVTDLNSRIQNAEKRLTNIRERIRSAEQAYNDIVSLNLSQPSPLDSEKLQSVTYALSLIKVQMQEFKKQYDHFRKDASITSCNVCGSILNKEESYAAAIVARDQYNKLKAEQETLVQEQTELLKLKSDNEIFNKWKTDKEDLHRTLVYLTNDKEIQVLEEQLKSDNELLQEEIAKPISSDKTDTSILEKQLEDYRVEIRQAEAEIRQAELYNAKVEPTNAEIDRLEAEYTEAKTALESFKKKQSQLQDESNDLAILQKSIKELVSYKIESEVKEFELLINEYLVELSSGRFALAFILDNAKLSVIIYRNGKETGIHTLSSGEKTLVNLSTLFAIRKIMSANYNLNLVFLDEVVSVLTNEDKDNLVDVLYKQEWQTMLVSHGYDNPLCTKLTIEKNNNISKILR